MKADPGPDPLDLALTDAKRATESMEPPADFTARVLALTATPRLPRALSDVAHPGERPRALSDVAHPGERPRALSDVTMWTQLTPVSRRIVPLAALAAAAALVLAWSADSRLDDTAPSALELAQENW